METPSDETINRKLAEFMGWEVYNFSVAGDMWVKKDHEFIDFKDQLYDGEILELGHPSKLYTTSLDALIPVVEKLMKEKSWNFDSYYSNEGIWKSTAYYCGIGAEYEISDKSPSRALAMAIFEVLDER